MQAYEFKTNIEEGTIKIPKDYLDKIPKEPKIRVILLTEDTSNENRDEIEYLMNNPLKIQQVKPLTREEVYDR